MFNQTWKKYLPVINILVKRSAISEQTMTLNHTDFERASGGRKMKWSFASLVLINGRLQNNGTKHSALATEMVAELQADEITSNLMKGQELEFSMTNDFKLLIKNAAATPVATEDASTTSVAAVEDSPAVEEVVTNEEVRISEDEEAGAMNATDKQ